MTETTFECNYCGEIFHGNIQASNEVISRTECAFTGCASLDEDNPIPTLCVKCGAREYVV